MGEVQQANAYIDPDSLFSFYSRYRFWRGQLKKTNIKDKYKSFKDKCSDLCAIAALKLCDGNQTC